MKFAIKRSKPKKCYENSGGKCHPKEKGEQATNSRSEKGESYNGSQQEGSNRRKHCVTSKIVERNCAKLVDT